MGTYTKRFTWPFLEVWIQESTRSEKIHVWRFINNNHTMTQTQTIYVVQPICVIDLEHKHEGDLLYSRLFQSGIHGTLSTSIYSRKPSYNWVRSYHGDQTALKLWHLLIPLKFHNGLCFPIHAQVINPFILWPILLSQICPIFKFTWGSTLKPGSNLIKLICRHLASFFLCEIVFAKQYIVSTGSHSLFF